MALQSNIMTEELAQGPYTVTVSDEARACTVRVTGRSNRKATVLQEERNNRKCEKRKKVR